MQNRIADMGTQTNIIRIRVSDSARTLGRGQIVSVIVKNSLNNADNTNNVSDILVGDAAAQPWQLLPGESTPELWYSDLKDVYVRLRVVGSTPTDAVVIVRRYAQPVRNIYDRNRAA